MSTVYGLPRYVGTFLRHMEAYKDLLKWNITEGSHKITLTLSWNFQQQKAGSAGARLKAALWDKLQRTLKLSSPVPGHTERQSVAKRPTNLPEELTKFLDASTTKKRTPTGSIRRQLSLHSPFKRQLSWSRYSALTMAARGSITRSHSNPITANHVGQRHGGSGSHRGNGTTTFSSSHNPSPVKAHPQSPSRYSWPGTSLDVDDPILHSTPNHSLSPPPPFTPESTPLSSPGGAEPSRVRYRDMTELAASMEDMMARVQQDNSERLRDIQKEWHQALTHWDEVLAQERAGNMLNTSSDSSEPPIPTDAVQKCLDSCDKILYRYSTDV